MILNNRKLYIWGFLTWLIPFVVSLPFFGADGELVVDLLVFKTIMFVTFGGLGTFLMVRLFHEVESNPLQNGLLIGAVWWIMNLVLDLIVLVGLLGTDLLEWFISPGAGYVLILITGAALGFVAQQRDAQAGVG